MNKKTKIAILGVIALVLVTIGVTYAYWLITRTQTGQNEITAGCLDISLSAEANDISLTNEFPMSDEDGMKLVPYEFTVTNNCNTSVDYQVALEATGDESSAISSSSLKVALNDSAKLYSSYSEIDPTVSGAYESRRIGFSRLAASGTEGSSDTYSLRIWIDEEAPISEMNKTFTSKISVTVGQGIESPYEEGTLAYSILSNYGGSNAVSEIDQTTYEHTITATGNVLMATSFNYYYGTEYLYNDSEGTYTLSGTITQATTTECRNGTKTCGKYTIIQSTSTATSATLYEVTDFQSSGGYVTANTIKYRNVFGTAETNASLNKTTDDLGNSYYFRGAPTNNYVEFGTYAAGSTVNGVTYETETPMYWRIVRINGDGSVRLIYDGTSLVANGTAHTARIGVTVYNDSNTAGEYAGYTYDTSGTNTTQVDSTIKGVIDAWYDANLETNYGSYIADSIFCNDRTVSSTTDSGNIYYEAYTRLWVNTTPVLTCKNKEDRYTVDDTTNGNGLLSNPVGLLTADEAFFAGGTLSTINKNYYLYSGEEYWTSAPYYFNKDVKTVYVGYVDDSGYVGYAGVNSGNRRARPVINLKADVLFEGNGTVDNPYKIVTE